MKNTLTSATPARILVRVGAGGGQAGRDALTVNTWLTGAVVAGRAPISGHPSRAGPSRASYPRRTGLNDRGGGAVQAGLTGLVATP